MPEKVTINGVEFTHCNVKAAGFKWHYVETGDTKAEPIVFLHGLPESWYSWHYQIEGLTPEYRCIALDMKGYGRTDKPEGSYKSDHVASETRELLDEIGLKKFNLVTHDWGTNIGDYIVSAIPQRILHYIRMECPVLVQESQHRPQFKLLKDQAAAKQIMSDPDTFIRMVYGKLTKQSLPDSDILRIIEEFSYTGIADAVPRYFRDANLEGHFEGEGFTQRALLFKSMNCPVLLLQADSDPNQPKYYFDRAVEAFPNATLQWVEDSGHFSELEQPEAVTAAIRNFVKSKG